MNKFIAGWYVLYTMPRHERKIAADLIAAGVEFYLPFRKVLRIWHDRKKYIDMPLFQSYIFVRIDDLKTYYQGLGIAGVLHYVRFGKEMARISEKVIDSIRLMVESKQDIEVTTEQFVQGQQLHISQGPLTGLSCEVVEVNHKQKILVRVNLLERNLLISVPPDYLLDCSEKYLMHDGQMAG